MSWLRYNLDVLLALQVKSVAHELPAGLVHPYGATAPLHHTLALVLLKYNLGWPEPN